MGRYLIKGREKTNDDAIFREVRYSPYSKILFSWICESWVFGHNIIEYLAITLHYTDKFFLEEDVVRAIELSESHLNMKNKTLLDDWEKIKLQLKKNR